MSENMTNDKLDQITITSTCALKERAGLLLILGCELDGYYNLIKNI